MGEFTTGGKKSLTTAEDSERGSVVLLDPFVPLLDEHTDGSGCRVEMSDLQSLHHLPVPPWNIPARCNRLTVHINNSVE